MFQAEDETAGKGADCSCINCSDRSCPFCCLFRWVHIHRSLAARTRRRTSFARLLQMCSSPLWSSMDTSTPACFHVSSLMRQSRQALTPGITSTLSKTLFSPSGPVHTPHGTTSPAGRYEGAILGLTALGPATIRQTLFQPEYIARVNQIAGEVYTGKNRNAVKAYNKAMTVLAGERPADSSPNVPAYMGGWEGVRGEVLATWGDWIGKAMEKSVSKAERENAEPAKRQERNEDGGAGSKKTSSLGWAVGELVRMKREQEAMVEG